jgi:tetratricopeptide (TPR) repeat protein
MKKRYFSLMVILFTLLLLVYGCGGNGGGGGDEFDKLIEQGWAKLDAGDFSGASGDFNAALGLSATAYDAYLGLGWSELRQSHGGLAVNAFVIYVDSTSDDKYQGRGGLALAYLADGEFQGAVTTAGVVLTAVPNWSFEHDGSINYLDLELVIVQGYYEMAEYEQCLDAIHTYFDSSFNPGDVNTNQGREALAEKIESLYTG